MFLLLPALLAGNAHEVSLTAVVLGRVKAPVALCAPPSANLMAANSPLPAEPRDTPTSDAPSFAPAGQDIELWRADDGLFYIDGVINGAPVRFVVDTGASMVVLTAGDAARAGVALDLSSPPVEAFTAGGPKRLDRVLIGSMEVAHTSVRSAPAVVADADLHVSLLGQSWLARLASVTIEGDRMRLRP